MVPRSPFNGRPPRCHLLALAVLTGLWLQFLAVPALGQGAAQDVPAVLTGELSVLYLDDFARGRAERVHLLRDLRTDQVVRLRFPGEPPGHLRSGALVRARGRLRGGELYLDANGTGTAAVETLAAAPPPVTGEQRTLVMVADFLDVSVSCSTASVRDLMFTHPTNGSIDDLYQETSFGNIWFTGEVVGPYTIGYTGGTCEFSAWADAADAAARGEGIEPDAYDRKVYVLPQNGCAASGIGSVGGAPSRAWVFTCAIADVYGHELGHNLGMYHASTPSGEYGDSTDIMGLAQNKLRQVNAPHKEQMGWLPPAQVVAVTQDGVFNVAPLEVDPAAALAPQALTLAKADTGEHYYLSYRRAIGFDANLSATRHLDRLSVHRYAGDRTPGNTYLLALLADDESFADPVNGITVTQLGHNPDYVTVRVELDATCAAAAPAVTVSPSSQSGTAGTALGYTVAVANRDTAACGQSSFDLAAAVPAGWAGTVSPPALALAPGQTGQATLSVTSASGAAQGFYSVGIDVADPAQPAHAAAGRATYEVAASGADTEPPTAPTGLSAHVTRKQVELSWNASQDNVGVSGYIVRRDGVVIGTASETRYVDRSLASGQTATYVVVATDRAGNVSGPSNEVTVTSPGGGGGGRGKKP